MSTTYNLGTSGPQVGVAINESFRPVGLVPPSESATAGTRSSKRVCNDGSQDVKDSIKDMLGEDVKVKHD